MSNPEEMLKQLISSINKLSTLVQDVNSSIDRLSSQITNLDSKIDIMADVPKSKSKKKAVAPPVQKTSITPEALDKKVEEYASPAMEEEPETAVTAAQADVAFDAVSKKFKHISQMITPQSSCGNISKMLEELRDEVETQVGMSPMLYELNSWVQRVSKMPDGDILLPDIHSELIEKLDDWLNRVTKAIHLKYANE